MKDEADEMGAKISNMLQGFDAEMIAIPDNGDTVISKAEVEVRKTLLARRADNDQFNHLNDAISQQVEETGYS